MTNNTTLTARVVVHGVTLVTLTPETSLEVDTPGPLALTLMTCVLYVTLVDVTMALVPCPSRHAHAARDDVTVAGSRPTGTDVAAVDAVGSSGAGCGNQHTIIRLKVWVSERLDAKVMLRATKQFSQFLMSKRFIL